RSSDDTPIPRDQQRRQRRPEPAPTLMTAPTPSSPLQIALDELDLGRSSTSPSTIQAVVDLAIEIAREGREGRKIGTLFTVGAERDVLARSRSLILDPLAGHPAKDRRVDDPNTRETLKE